MKKKLWIKILSMVIVCVFIMHTSAVGTFAATKEEAPENIPITMTATNDVVIDEVLNIISRYIIFTYLYNTGEINRVKNLQLLSIRMKEHSADTSTATLEFLDKNIFGQSNVVVTILFGGKQHWDGILDSGGLTFNKIHSIYTILLGIAASGSFGGAEIAQEAIFNGMGRLIGSYELQRKIGQLTDGGTLAYIAGFLYNTKFLGQFSQEWFSSDSLILANDGVAPVPENVELPDWVENGPAPIIMK